MKIQTACKVCGKRAKRIALENGKTLCLKHYNIRIREET